MAAKKSRASSWSVAPSGALREGCFDGLRLGGSHPVGCHEARRAASTRFVIPGGYK